jgi:hypothetical protein
MVASDFTLHGKLVQSTLKNYLHKGCVSQLDDRYRVSEVECGDFIVVILENIKFGFCMAPVLNKLRCNILYS